MKLGEYVEAFSYRMKNYATLDLQRIREEDKRPYLRPLGQASRRNLIRNNLFLYIERKFIAVGLRDDARRIINRGLTIWR